MDGNELRDKAGSSLGETLPQERGVSRVGGQDRLTANELPDSPACNQLDASLSYTQRVQNVLNDNIRVSTPVLKDIAPCLAGA